MGAVTAHAEEWFGGTDGRTEEEQAFLSAVRAAAASSGWGITAGATASMSLDVPLYLSVDVPAMTTFPGTRAARQLEVTLWPEDSHRGLRLDGLWGNSDTPLDDVWVFEGGKLLVVGVQAQVEDLGQWTVSWIEHQLERRLRFRMWRAGGATATTDDTGEYVGRSWPVAPARRSVLRGGSAGRAAPHVLQRLQRIPVTK